MKKISKYLFAIIIVVSCMLCVVACGEQEPEITGITATVDENYTVYLLDDFDTSRILVTAQYSNKPEEPVPASELQFSKFDTSIVGEQALTITYKGKTATVNINVSDSNKRAEEGIKQNFMSNGKRPCWKVRNSVTGKWRYFEDEALKHEVTEEELVIPKYVASSAVMTKEPTATEKGIVTITTTSGEQLRVYIPCLDVDNVFGYYRVSQATWTENGSYEYRLDVDELANDWWGMYEYERESDEYNITNQVEKVRACLETLAVSTDTVAPAFSTKFVIDKVGSTMLDGEHTSRVVVSGRLLYGKLDTSMSFNNLSIYFKGEKVPFSERFNFKSLELMNAETNEYKIVTNFYTASDNVALGTNGIQCSYRTNEPLNDIIVKPGDEIISTERQRLSIAIQSIDEGQTISQGDVLRVGDYPCKILSIRDITNNKALAQVASDNTSLIYMNVEILHYMDVDMDIYDSMAIRTGQELGIWRYLDGRYEQIDRQIATAKVTAVISRIKADIKVSGTDEIKEGGTIENLVPGDMIVDALTHFADVQKIGVAHIMSVPNAVNEEGIYKDVVLEIQTTSLPNLPSLDENFFSRECVDFLNGCLSQGETIKVYNDDGSVAITITITAYNFD